MAVRSGTQRRCCRGSSPRAPVSELRARHSRRRRRRGPPPEDPGEHVADVWSVPIQMVFAQPRSLRPDGVAALFSMTALQIVMEPGFGVAEIVGEGPASIDAPIILPTTIPATTVDVPILMYHLVGSDPARVPSSRRPTGGGSRWDSRRCRARSTRRWHIWRASERHAISLQHLADALLYGLPLPPAPVRHHVRRRPSEPVDERGPGAASVWLHRGRSFRAPVCSARRSGLRPT